MTHESFKARATCYYPSDLAMEGGFKDERGKPLCTLQEFLAGEAPYVSLAMDKDGFPYGTRIVIPEIDLRYGKPVVFRRVDNGGAFNKPGRNLGRIDICVADRKHSLDDFLNADFLCVAVLEDRA